MRKRLIRILSVFLTVVIICCSFLQPVAYANTAVAGGVVLLIAAMLTASGLTFSSAQQAQSTASNVIGAMPPDLFAAIQDAFLESTVVGVGKFYEMMEKGIDSVVPVTKELFAKFRAWVDGYFGIDEAAVEAGNVSLTNTGHTGKYVTVTDMDGNPRELFVYPYVNSGKYDATFVPAFDFVLGGKLYKFVRTDDRQTSGSTSYGFAEYTFDGVEVKSWFAGSSKNVDYTTIPIDFRLSYNAWGNLSIVRTLNRGDIVYSSLNSTNSYFRDTAGKAISILSVDTNLGVNSEAYAHTIPADKLVLTIAIPVTAEMLADKSYLDILNGYELDNWDFKESLEKMREQLEKNVDVLNSLGWEALQSNTISLQLEVDALRVALAAEGIDVIGGVNALNDAMVDAGLVIQGLEHAIAQGQAASETMIIELTLELVRVREELARLLQEREIDEPKDPPVSESKGKIKWEILLNLAIFKKFPFSLPKDVYAFVTALAAPPKEPVFEFDLFGSIAGGILGDAGKITIDFKRFEKIRVLFRNGFLIAFIVGLMTATKKYIWTGGG